MKSKTFVLSVLLPLAALLVLLVLIAGCVTPQQRKQQGGCQRPRVLAFTASWCAPCQRAKPTLIQIQAAGVDVQIIDIDEHHPPARAPEELPDERAPDVPRAEDDDRHRAIAHDGSADSTAIA